MILVEADQIEDTSYLNRFLYQWLEVIHFLHNYESVKIIIFIIIIIIIIILFFIIIYYYFCNYYYYYY